MYPIDGPKRWFANPKPMGLRVSVKKIPDFSFETKEYTMAMVYEKV